MRDTLKGSVYLCKGYFKGIPVHRDTHICTVKDYILKGSVYQLKGITMRSEY